jgi:hypothetical protein
MPQQHFSESQTDTEVKHAKSDAPSEQDFERLVEATYHAGRGVGALPLKSFHGWSLLSTAQVYLSESATKTQRAIRAAHSQ